MHGNYRHTEVNCIDIMVRNEHSYGSAAACIYLTELCSLPDNAVLLKYFSDEAEELCGCVVGSALSASTGVLADNGTAGNNSAVALFVYVCEIGIKRSVNVGAEALGMRSYRSGILTALGFLPRE